MPPDTMAGREMTREEAFDRMMRAEEAVRHLAFVLSDLHGDATRLADERATLGRQLRACDAAMAGGKIPIEYWSSAAARGRQLFEERNEYRDQLAKLREQTKDISKSPPTP